MTHDKLPQMRALSTNLCPNSRPRAITDPSMCDQWALTTWGWCSECYQEDRVPAAWLRAIEAETARLTGR
jgi:hypothetical protein